MFCKGFLLPGELGFLAAHHSASPHPFPLSMQGTLHHPARVSPVSRLHGTFSTTSSSEHGQLLRKQPWRSCGKVVLPASFNFVPHLRFSRVPFVSKARSLLNSRKRGDCGCFLEHAVGSTAVGVATFVLESLLLRSSFPFFKEESCRL